MRAERIPSEELVPLAGNYWRMIYDEAVILDRVALPGHITTATAALALLLEMQKGPTPEQIAAEQHAVLRAERDRLLRETDWTQLADSPVDRARWAIYRQQLRDLPANTPDPAKPVWPRRPDDTDTQAARTVLFVGKN